MIIIVAPSLRLPGGISSVVKAQCNWFSRNSIEYKIVATIVPGVYYKYLGFLLSLITMVVYLIFHKCSVVHIHLSSRGSSFRKCILCGVCIIGGAKYVLHLHGSEFREFYDHELSHNGKYLVRLLFSKAQKIIALSNSWRGWIEDSFKLKNVIVIHNGVESVKRESTHSRTKTILFLGRIGKRKGVDILLKAMIDVVKVIPDARLVIGGDGDIESFQSMCSPLGGSVTFLGWIGPEDKEKELNNAAVYCLPSWNEGLPMSILEAMSAGLPVVSTPVGGIPEAVIHGQNGYLVPPGDDSALAQALIRLLSDPELATKMGHEGRRLYEEHFSADRMCASFVELYDSCKKI